MIMRKYKYQACVISSKGIEFVVVWAHSESEAMSSVFEKMPEGASLYSIKNIN